MLNPQTNLLWKLLAALPKNKVHGVKCQIAGPETLFPSLPNAATNAVHVLDVALPVFSPPPPYFLPLGCLCLCLRLSCPGDVLSVNLHVTWHLYWHWIAFCLGLPSYAGGSLLVCVCLSTASCRTSLPASFVCQRLLVRLYLWSSCICVFVYLTIKVLRAAWTSSRFKCVNCCSLKQLFSYLHLTP